MEDNRGLKSCIEALLFASGEPLTLAQIAEVLDTTPLLISKVIEELKNEKEQSGGLMIREVAGGIQLCTKPQYHKIIQKLFGIERFNNLTAATIETLAIIAYKQPITRAEIEDIRGVKVEKALATLLNRGLITEVGRKEGIGRPILYGTTEEFLKQFGLKNLEDLTKITS
ncbi:segregation and condensation protein B [Anaerobranca californiensis DSM 14826]|jgi:segregation and condensation protein B|uniref:Segregation and condensation protein B n=1 Tax=Anaerobranca californiensis DSM 14826 TaxID=1120989 RepID=A0A1M6L186_9FIRM|nr:SMC-Scp complex subunit ScpB [Anaerobranca californiensis]SHJ64991.1 segregation and condensation protein B [Anaerobranca californiensis DSM 14826]